MANPDFSILFNHPAPPLDGIQPPACLRDLNLDQIIEAATVAKKDYDLQPFFYLPLADAETIVYRQEVARDLQDNTWRGHIGAFAEKIAAGLLTTPQAIACALLEVGRTGLTLELPAGIMPGPSWVGRQVDGFFQIGQGAAAAKRKIFYHFSTVVSAVPKAGKHAAMLALALPDNIILSQKRAFLRMAPPSSAIPVFEILPADDATLRQCLAWLLPPPPPGEGQEPQPPATLPSLGRFKIKDISGGGGRVAARLADNEGPQRQSLAAGVGCYVALELQADPPRRYVLGATVRRVFRESAGVLDLGLEFTSRLKGLSPDTGLPVWKALKGKGDESIENWVVRKYLEIYRDKGVEPAA
jgi:hypothetical protein